MDDLELLDFLNPEQAMKLSDILAKIFHQTVELFGEHN